MRWTDIIEAKCKVEEFLEANGEGKIYACEDKSNQSCSCKEVRDKLEELYKELNKLNTKQSEELWWEIWELDYKSWKELCEKLKELDCENLCKELKELCEKLKELGKLKELDCENLCKELETLRKIRELDYKSLKELCEKLKELGKLSDEELDKDLKCEELKDESVVLFAIYVNLTNQYISIATISKNEFSKELCNKKQKIEKLLQYKFLQSLNGLLNDKLFEFLQVLQKCPNIFNITKNGFWIGPFNSFTKAHSFAELLANVIYLTTHEKMRVSTGSGINHNPYKIF